jgi:hypothetical protein
VAFRNDINVLTEITLPEDVSAWFIRLHLTEAGYLRDATFLQAFEELAACLISELLMQDPFIFW